MTRAGAKPLRRVVLTRYDGDLVLELTDRVCRLRPPRTRREGPAEVVLTWGQIYDAALTKRAEEAAREKRRRQRERRRQ